MHDAVLLAVGIQIPTLTMFIPQQIETTLTGYCTADCTESAFPEEGVTVFATNLHAHTAGKALSFRHVRDGVELEPLDVNENYDFNYQQTTSLSEVTIYPGGLFCCESKVELNVYTV